MCSLSNSKCQCNVYVGDVSVTFFKQLRMVKVEVEKRRVSSKIYEALGNVIITLF